MGILYSHIVFQPPSPPTYQDHAGFITFRKIRPEAYDSDLSSSDNESAATAAATAGATTADVSGEGSTNDQDIVQHPVIYLTTSKGNTIPVAYFPQPNSHYIILFSHGNGEDLGVTASYALELSTCLSTSVICYDYSGYGVSTGRASETNCYADIRAVHNYVLTELRILPQRILLFGRSLGSGPTLDLAAALGTRVGGVVLIAALTSCVRVVFPTLPHSTRIDMFPNIDKMPRVAVPVFCVHGMIDNVVPFSHGIDLVRAARFPLEPLWIDGAGHNNLESPRFQYQVFLRYMKALHEFQRWAPPAEARTRFVKVSRRRESFGALVKVAGCFGPRSEDATHGSDAERLPHGGRRRTSRLGWSSHGLLNPVVNRHEEGLRTLCDEQDDKGAAKQDAAAGNA